MTRRPGNDSVTTLTLLLGGLFAATLLASPVAMADRGDRDRGHRDDRGHGRVKHPGHGNVHGHGQGRREVRTRIHIHAHVPGVHHSRPPVVYARPPVIYSAPRVLYSPHVVYAPPIVYSSAPIYVERPAPPIYVERNDQPPQAATQPGATGDSYWYYCTDSSTFYPYVTQCASPWERVAPQPPSVNR